MIDHNLKEPQIKECVVCLRNHGHLKGCLVHWPSENCTKETIRMPGGMKIEPFSMWLYTCRWCRGVATKRKNADWRLNMNGAKDHVASGDSQPEQERQ